MPLLAISLGNRSPVWNPPHSSCTCYTSFYARLPRRPCGAKVGRSMVIRCGKVVMHSFKKKKGGGLILSRPRFNPGSDTQPAHNLGPTQRRPRFNHNPYTQQSQVRPWVYRAGGQRSAVFYHTAGPRSTLIYYIQPAKVKL